MEKHTCKLCFRRFSNGRALGGHMRSHVAAAAAGVAASASAVAPAAGDSSTSSREAEEDELGDGKGLVLSYGLRENPRKSFRLVDPEFSSSLAVVDAGSSVVQDLESETESPRPVPCHRRRSKRSRRFPPPPPDPEPVSSVSDTTPEEDVAISLMLLSRDVWTKSAEAEESSDGDDDESEDEQIVAGSGRGGRDSGERRRSRFQCETCKKVFRSYQALGGHRASHKKLKQSCSPAAAVKTRIPEANADRKVHECPVCFRVFGSGQALGGHKRSHLSSSSPSLPPPPSPATAKLGGESLIDLNLPAPMEEDAAELSAVSDASEFVVGNLPSY